jgi:F-type H+-transporting ATPase subunit b
MTTGHEVAHGPGMAELLAFFNIVVIAAVVLIFARKGIATFFASRASAIRERLAASKQELGELERRIAESERQLSDFVALKKKMLEDVRSEALGLSEKLVADAEKSAKQILVDARLAAEQESREAVDSLRDRLIDEALRQVREQLAKDPAQRERMHESLVENFAAQLRGGN